MLFRSTRCWDCRGLYSWLVKAVRKKKCGVGCWACRAANRTTAVRWWGADLVKRAKGGQRGVEQETGRSPKNDCGSQIGMYAATLFQGRSRSSQTTQLPYCSSPGVPSAQSGATDSSVESRESLFLSPSLHASSALADTLSLTQGQADTQQVQSSASKRV